MKLEPYTVPEQDADLWQCGVRYEPTIADRAKRHGLIGHHAQGESLRNIWAVMLQRDWMELREIAREAGVLQATAKRWLVELHRKGIVRHDANEVHWDGAPAVNVGRSRWSIA